MEDLKVDLLNLVEFIMEFEEKFHVEISDEVANFLTFIGTIQAL